MEVKMAFATINLGRDGLIKEAPVGFSWTTLFFGMFPALFRGDFKWGLIMLIAALLTSFLASLIFMFIYNKIYLKSLLEKGYTSIDSEEVLSPIEAKLTMKIPRKS